MIARDALLNPCAAAIFSGDFMRRAICLFLIAIAATPARAEIFEMNGHFPARWREVSLARSIGVDRIAGRDGAALALAIEDRLARTGPDGAPYYDLIALTRNGPDADMIVSGMADATVRDSNVKRQVEQCAERSGDKCVRKEKVEALCLQQTVNFSSTLRVADSVNGRILYTENRPQTDIIVTCPGDKDQRTPRDSIRRMVDTAASRFVDDITPRHENYRVRLREGREGMDKATGQRFRDSVKLSQRDADAACARWSDMDRALPGNASLLFNLGLCAERRGEYGVAEAFYTRAGQGGIRGGEFREGVERVRNLAVGRADAAERARERR